MEKHQLIVGTKLIHSQRGECEFTSACLLLEKTNPDPSSTFVEFDGSCDAVEVSLACLKEKT